MKVFKFGGASVKDALGVKNLLSVIKTVGHKDTLVVVSAMGKTTNALEKIIDDYFTANSIEGVTVSLYSIMFTAADLNFTHEVIFSGEAEAMAKLYSPNFQDTAWQLFSSKINNFIICLL